MNYVSLILFKNWCEDILFFPKIHFFEQGYYNEIVYMFIIQMVSN